MLGIQQVNHVGIRIGELERSRVFYQALGFKFVSDAGFKDGHPVIMRHPCDVVLNLLGPSKDGDGSNILMDVDEKYPGITHVALTVDSLEKTKEFLAEHNIEITGSFAFGSMAAVFIRDPDRNVTELDEVKNTGSTNGLDGTEKIKDDDHGCG